MGGDFGWFLLEPSHIQTPAQNRLVLHDHWAVGVQISHTFQVNVDLGVLYHEHYEIESETPRAGLGKSCGRSVFDAPESYIGGFFKLMLRPRTWSEMFL